MPNIGLFYTFLARNFAIPLRPPILLLRYRSSGPATLTGNISLRYFGTAAGSRQSELDIDEIDNLISKESTLLCDVIEGFIKKILRSQTGFLRLRRLATTSSSPTSESHLIGMVPQISYFTISLRAIVMKSRRYLEKDGMCM